MSKPEVFCDSGAASDVLRELEQQGKVTLLVVPEDADIRHGGPRVSDLFLRMGAKGVPRKEDTTSPQYEAILGILGFEHRREATLLDAAKNRGCTIFVTQDSDVLRRREKLEALLAGLRILHPFRDEAALRALGEP